MVLSSRNSKAPAEFRGWQVMRTAVALVAGMVLGAGTALANPQGATVVSGGISITMPNSTTLDVTQTTNNGIINWQSFNIANGEKTIFQQPSTAATTLNKIGSNFPSTIAGQLTANGNLILINPNGIIFAKGSQVNANSLIATPSDIRDEDFLAGNLKFQPGANPNASVINAGHITVGQNGLAALVAPNVVNSG